MYKTPLGQSLLVQICCLKKNMEPFASVDHSGSIGQNWYSSSSGSVFGRRTQRFGSVFWFWYSSSLLPSKI